MSSIEGGSTGPREPTPVTPTPSPSPVPVEAEDGRPPKVLDEDEPPAPAEAGEALWFDGRRLNHVRKPKPGEELTPASMTIGGCTIDRSGRAVSGRIGITCSSTDQKKWKVGPLPESFTKYTANPKTTQYWSDLDIIAQAKARVGHGTYEWGPTAWGIMRTPIAIRGRKIEFADGSWPRDAFYIHGGSEPGSAGCIDLYAYNDLFHEWFKAHGKTLRVIVRYLPLTRRRTFCHDVWWNCPDNPGLPCDVFDAPRNTVCRYHTDDSLYESEKRQMLQDEICPAIR